MKKWMIIGSIVPVVIIVITCRSLWPGEYPADDIVIKQVQALETGEVEIIFYPKGETLYYCPGINVLETENKITISFVRCWIELSCGVAYKVRKGEGWEHIVRIDHKGKALFVHNGEEEGRIYPSDN